MKPTSPVFQVVYAVAEKKFRDGDVRDPYYIWQEAAEEVASLGVDVSELYPLMKEAYYSLHGRYPND